MVNNINAHEEAHFNFFVCLVCYNCDKVLTYELHKLQQILKNCQQVIKKWNLCQSQFLNMVTRPRLQL
jgi:hypothetical protein